MYAFRLTTIVRETISFDILEEGYLETKVLLVTQTLRDNNFHSAFKELTTHKCNDDDREYFYEQADVINDFWTDYGLLYYDFNCIDNLQDIEIYGDLTSPA